MKPRIESDENGLEASEHENRQELSQLHREYLIRRHGTEELDPMPRMDDADPLNWPKYKKVINLLLIAFHAFMGTFSASAIQSAFTDIATDLDVSVQRASYLTSLVIAILGGAPILFRPLAHVYGRRPIFMISLLGSFAGNVGCVFTHSYATMGLCRAIMAFFISPASSLGSAVVSETFFRQERGRYMGIWTAMVTLGVPLGPLIFGFVAHNVGYRWIYWILAITNAVQLILYFFFGPESRYVPTKATDADDKPHTSSWKKQHFNFGRLDPTPLTISDFLHPFLMAGRLCVMIPAAAYAMVFLWGAIMLSIEIPQIYPERYGFNTQQVGLQYISLLVGTILGEQIGGFMSDKWMYRREKKIGKLPMLEFRLWLSYIGYALTICGVVVFLVQLDHTKSWSITPLVGAAMAAVGNQIVTTVMMTYAVDCYNQDSAAIGVFVSFVRQTWGFIGPFWFPEMIEELGFVKSIAVPIAMIVGVSVIPTVLLQWRGHTWRPVRTEI